MTKSKCDQAVILAAGGGARVRSLAPDRPKCLMDLGGRPIIQWVLEALAGSGIAQVVMVTGFGAPELRRVVSRGGKHGLAIRYVHNPRWKEANGLSLYAARRALATDRPFLALMSDHLLPPRIIKKVAGAPSSRCVLAVDTDVEGVFDISDATKVRLVDGKPVAIGKRLRSYDAVDCGLFRLDRRVFPALESAFRDGRMALTDGIRMLIRNGALDVLSVEDMFWIDIDTPQAFRQAAKNMDRFLSSLHEERK
jgi:choline kinase